ncbi:MAG TPA: hypothetical protein VGH27_30855 [Streptosporangiaceae bacterium]|jgi:hypothetical protein
MPYGKNELTPLELCRARGVLRRQVAAMLRGSRLEMRELTNHLAVVNPDDLDKGQIQIGYATGEVSCRRTSYEYLGPLQGYEPDDDPDREPSVDAAKIISMLTESPAPGQPQ